MASVRFVCVHNAGRSQIAVARPAIATAPARDAERGLNVGQEDRHRRLMTGRLDR